MASLTKLGALGAATVTVHTALNARLLRVPPEASPLERRISILVPARNEAERIETCLRALLVQQMLTDWEILVLDDCSDALSANVRTLS
jgi:cellulose synthase/poly-beta-1,6-N-acetylglucosamine synthase-like glycosyltransferase